MTLACTQVQGINLAQGVCDTGVPPIVVDAATQAMEQGINTYTRFDGLAELRQAGETNSKLKGKEVTYTYDYSLRQQGLEVKIIDILNSQ